MEPLNKYLGERFPLASAYSEQWLGMLRQLRASSADLTPIGEQGAQTGARNLKETTLLSAMLRLDRSIHPP